MDKKTIAQRIRFYRKLGKLTQEKLAERVGVSDTYIRKLEAGQRTPSLEIVLDIAEALKTTPDHLVLPMAKLSSNMNHSAFDFLEDCSSDEYEILYENMVNLHMILHNRLK